MKNMLTALLDALLLVGLAWAPVLLGAAEDAGNRACNQQGREIALRLSEEVSSDLRGDDRNRIAAIAEQVCREFAGPATENMPVVSRPDTARPAAAAQVPAQAEAAVEAPDEEEEGGLFGNVRIIDPEDRVQRPGLKRR